MEHMAAAVDVAGDTLAAGTGGGSGRDCCQAWVAVGSSGAANLGQISSDAR